MSFYVPGNRCALSYTFWINEFFESIVGNFVYGNATEHEHLVWKALDIFVDVPVDP